MEDLWNKLADNNFFIVVLASLIFTLYKLIDYKIKNKKEIVDITRKDFEYTLSGLHSNNELEKVTYAILLRRFLNPFKKTIFTKFDYREESVNVIASLLRIEKYGEFQKTLADSLSWTDNLKGMDFQYANMQNMYLKPQNTNSTKQINMSMADLYMSDLSYASLNKIKGRDTVFNSANLFCTVFRDCDLTSADFRNSNLLNSRFCNTILDGAKFSGASNIPDNIISHLNAERVYEKDRTKCSFKPDRTNKIVFVSCLGALSPKQSDYLNSLVLRLQRKNVLIKRYTRDEYRKSGQIGGIRNEMCKCRGVIIIGFKHIIVNSGVIRPASIDKQLVENEWLSAPWNSIEAGIATALGLPLLIIKDRSINDGIFDDSINDKLITKIDANLSEYEFEKQLNKWLQIL